MATVLWIGGMTTNIFVILPATRETLEPPVVGRFMGSIMKRFRKLTYISIVLLAATGIIMTLLNQHYEGLMQFTSLWSQVMLVKHIVTGVMVVLVIISFEVVAPKVAELAANGPSQHLLTLQNVQMRMARIGLIFAIIIALLTGISTAISALT